MQFSPNAVAREVELGFRVLTVWSNCSVSSGRSLYAHWYPQSCCEMGGVGKFPSGGSLIFGVPAVAMILGFDASTAGDQIEFPLLICPLTMEKMGRFGLSWIRLQGRKCLRNTRPEPRSGKEASSLTSLFSTSKSIHRFLIQIPDICLHLKDIYHLSDKYPCTITRTW